MCRGGCGDDRFAFSARAADRMTQRRRVQPLRGAGQELRLQLYVGPYHLLSGAVRALRGARKVRSPSRAHRAGSRRRAPGSQSERTRDSCRSIGACKFSRIRARRFFEASTEVTRFAAAARYGLAPRAAHRLDFFRPRRDQRSGARRRGPGPHLHRRRRLGRARGGGEAELSGKRTCAAPAVTPPCCCAESCALIFCEADVERRALGDLAARACLPSPHSERSAADRVGHCARERRNSLRRPP